MSTHEKYWTLLTKENSPSVIKFQMLDTYIAINLCTNLWKIWRKSINRFRFWNTCWKTATQSWRSVDPIRVNLCWIFGWIPFSSLITWGDWMWRGRMDGQMDRRTDGHMEHIIPISIPLQLSLTGNDKHRHSKWNWRVFHICVLVKLFTSWFGEITQLFCNVYLLKKWKRDGGRGLT